MYLGQHNQSAAISLFMESLQHGYSLEPPDQLLTSVCEAMEKTKATYNLYTVVKKLIDRGISVCYQPAGENVFGSYSFMFYVHICDIHHVNMLLSGQI